VNREKICPPNRRGHTWRELSKLKGDPSRICARCGALGRVNKQGLIDVVQPAEVTR
jgi:hypothetical protein